MPQDRLDLRRRLVALVASQSGYFTAAQARQVGYSYQAQKYHADRGNWLRVSRGIFRLTEWPAGEWEYLVRWYLWSRGRGVVSHESALVVHDLGDVNPSRVHLTVPPDFGRSDPHISLHKAELPDVDVQTREGFRLTTPLRTLADVAADSLADDQLVQALRDAFRVGMITIARLRSKADEVSPMASLRIERALSRLEA